MAAKINDAQLSQLLEACLFASDRPLTVDDLQTTVLLDFQLTKKRLQQALKQLALDYQGRGIELVETAKGYRFQSKAEWSPFIALLWPERSPKYSRAVLETLALIAYRQPITRGEIEEIRGVTVSSQMIRTLLDRGWIKVVGHKEVPGRPGLYATTADFLTYFGLKSLAQLPTLPELAKVGDLFNTVGMTEESLS